jgi:hypothetical protein
MNLEALDEPSRFLGAPSRRRKSPASAFRGDPRGAKRVAADADARPEIGGAALAPREYAITMRAVPNDDK